VFDLESWGKAVLIWLALAAAGFINGIAREAITSPALGEGLARPLSAFTLLILVFALAWIWFRWAGSPGGGILLAVGILWLVLTITFEIALGVMRGLSLPALAAQYNPLSPSLWDLVLLGILTAPTLAAAVAQR
jgi:hypothetical protein